MSKAPSPLPYDTPPPPAPPALRWLRPVYFAFLIVWLVYIGSLLGAMMGRSSWQLFRWCTLLTVGILFVFVGGAAWHKFMVDRAKKQGWPIKR